MADDYKRAFERQKQAREYAEKLLEDKSRELFQLNQDLMMAYEKLQEQNLHIIHQEKLASIGQLSAGVAHEINNPIGFISNNLEVLKQYNDSLAQFIDSIESSTSVEKLVDLKKQLDLNYVMEDSEDLIKDCIEGAVRISDIVDSMNRISRNDKDQVHEFSINDCIETTLKLVKNEIKYSAELEVNLEGNPNVIGNHGNLCQVILNLIVNGSQAIESQKQVQADLVGKIIVETNIQMDLLVISIKDNGTGIDEEAMQHIFEPFFTTKALGEGTGLGLSISDSIIDKMGGSLEVETKVGEGTKFKISIPLGS